MRTQPLESSADLIAVLGVTVLTAPVVMLDIFAGTLIRACIALIYLLFTPGYAVVAVFFPRGVTHTPSDSQSQTTFYGALRAGRIDLLERGILSFALSVPIVIGVGIVLGAFGMLSTREIYGVLAVLTALFTIVAKYRRGIEAEEDRLGTILIERLQRVSTQLFASQTHGERLVNAVLIGTIVAALLTTGFGNALSEDPDAGFTEVYLLPGNQTGELTGSDYPDSLTVGEAEPFTLVIQNHEGARTEYSIVGLLQRTEEGPESAVVEEMEVFQNRVTLAGNETARLNHRITPEMRGRSLKLTYLVFVGDFPETRSDETAYRELHVWTNVSAATNSRVHIGSGPTASAQLRPTMEAIRTELR